MPRKTIHFSNFISSLVKKFYQLVVRYLLKALWSPATLGSTTLVVVVMTRHCSFYPFMLFVRLQMVRLNKNISKISSKIFGVVFHLAGHISIAGHVAHPNVFNVGVNILFKRRKSWNIRVYLLANYHHLEKGNNDISFLFL